MKTCLEFYLIAMALILHTRQANGRPLVKGESPEAPLTDHDEGLLSYTTATAPTRLLVLDSLRGTYSFSYDTGNGEHQSFRTESRDETGKVMGRYGYVDPDGVLRITDYVADHLGFRAVSRARYNRVSTGPPLIGPIPSPIVNDESRLKTLKIPFSAALFSASLAKQNVDLLPG